MGRNHLSLSMQKKQGQNYGHGDDEATLHHKFIHEQQFMVFSEKNCHWWLCKYFVEVSPLADGDAIKRLVRIESGNEVSK